MKQTVTNHSTNPSKLQVFLKESGIDQKWWIALSIVCSIGGLFHKLSRSTVCHEIFAGVYFCGLEIFCVLRELIFAIRTDWFF